MRPTRTLRTGLTALAGLLVSAALVAGCGAEEHEEGVAFREGLAEELSGLTYNVFLTRQLNLNLPEDRAYYDGPPAPAGSALFGVFLEVCNDDEEGVEAVPSAERFRIVDTQGAEFEPIELPEDNVFAYHPEPLLPRECIPARGSVPQLGPTGGSMLLFRLPLEATENRPIELEIFAPPGSPHPEETLSFELDL